MRRTLRYHIGTGWKVAGGKGSAAGNQRKALPSCAVPGRCRSRAAASLDRAAAEQAQDLAGAAKVPPDGARHVPVRQPGAARPDAARPTGSPGGFLGDVARILSPFAGSATSRVPAPPGSRWGGETVAGGDGRAQPLLAAALGRYRRLKHRVLCDRRSGGRGAGGLALVGVRSLTEQGARLQLLRFWHRGRGVARAHGSHAGSGYS
jgi:hypothetical protein